MNRRRFLAAPAGLFPVLAARKQSGVGFGLGNYGLKPLQAPDAVRLVHRIGYDAIEFTMMPGWPTEPKAIGKPARRELRDLVRELDLQTPALLEQIPLMKDHASNLERIKLDAEFGHDISPDRPPMIQTHLGGRHADWDQLKNQVVERLRSWAETGKSVGTVIAIKGHSLNLMDSSDKTFWVIRQVGSPWLRVLYDYSHYQPIGESLANTLELLLPYTAMISIKDARKYPAKEGFERLLPGDGTVDYSEYFSILRRSGYSGCVVVEVSGQIQAKPGYDPVKTAELCYARMAPLLAQAGIERARRSAARSV